ncbi:MAG: NUDIX domain-containing protein [Muribaculaceae bacterium]|nr:NUDIX domain-containing protein [Muribaculaceae bacterium]
MNKDNDKEIFPVVDEEGNVVGSASRGECHGGSKLLHPVVHLHLFDTDGRLYLQKRPEWKDIQPGKWDTAVGGHVDFGEEIRDALRREFKEELGLEVDEVELLRRYVFESARERELVHSFKAVTDAIPRPTDELDGGRFWTIAEIESKLGTDVFTPNFESEYTMLFSNPKPAQH